MLFIVFKACSDCYAIEARTVIEVIPLVTLRKCPGAPDYVAGLANYRGLSVPVVDFNRMVAGSSCPALLGARIILSSYAGSNDRRRTAGLLVEVVLETVEREEAEFSQEAMAASEASCLGKLAVHGNEFVQRIALERVLPKELDALLFAEQENTAL